MKLYMYTKQNTTNEVKIKRMSATDKLICYEIEDGSLKQESLNNLNAYKIEE